MISSGMIWPEINRQVKEEIKTGNILANLIFKLNFDKNQVSLILDAVNEDEKEDQKFQIDDMYLTNFDPVVKVEIDLTTSA